MASFNFIPPPSLLDQQHIVTHQVHHPGVALQNQQHVTVHQVHHPGAVIHHPPPFVHHALPIAPFVHDPFSAMYHQAPLMHPVMHPAIHPAIHPTLHSGAMAMQKFAPGTLQQHLVRQPRRLAHILTYSTARMANGDAAAHALYEQALIATGLQPLLTFNVGHFPAPPGPLAAQFTGVSGPIQEVVRQCEEGMRDLDEVVRLMMAAYDQDGGSLLLVVACPGGTHRSVAVAEIIKKKLLRRGVTTVHLNHVHRVRRPGDAV